MTPSSSHQSPRLWIQERQVHTVLRLRVQEVPGHAQARRCSLRDPSGARQEAPWDHEHSRAQLRRSYHQDIRPTIRQNFRQPRTRVGDAA